MLTRALNRGRQRRLSARRRIGEILRLSVAVAPLAERRERVAALGVGGLRGLATAAERHGIAGYVWLAAGELDSLRSEERVALKRSSEAAVGTHVRILAALDVVRQAFDAEFRNWLVVKGPVLTDPVHGRPDLRSYGDLDIVVPGGEFGRALAILEALGGETLDRNWPLLTRELRGEVHVRLHGGVLVDLHWHLINDRRVRAAFGIPMLELFERTRRLRVGALRVPTLDLVDTLIHVAVHAVLSGGHRLVWFKDVERVAALGIDWDAVIQRARAWRVNLAVGLALWRVQTLMGADVPDDVVGALLPSRAWRSVTAAAARLAPVEQETGSSSVNRLVARSTRATTSTSAATVIRKAFTQARRRGDAQQRASRSFDNRSPGSLSYQSGDDRDRQRFLAAVAEAEQVS